MEKLTSGLDFSTPTTAQAITFFEGIFNRIAANPRLEKYRKLNWIKVCGRLVNIGLSLNACEHAERMLRDLGFRELADERGHLWLEDASTVATAAQNFQDQVNLHRALFMSRVAAQPGPTSAASTSSSSGSSSNSKGATADLDSASKKRSRRSINDEAADSKVVSSESSSQNSNKRRAVGANTPSIATCTAELVGTQRWKIGDRVRVWWCPKLCEGAACFCPQADARQYGATISSVRGAMVEVDYDPTDEWPEETSDEFRSDDMKLRRMSAKDELLVGQKTVSSSSSGHLSRAGSVTDSDKYRENFAHLGSSSSSSRKANGTRGSERSLSPVRGVKRRTPRKRGHGLDLKRALRETGLARLGSRSKSEPDTNGKSTSSSEMADSETNGESSSNEMADSSMKNSEAPRSNHTDATCEESGSSKPDGADSQKDATGEKSRFSIPDVADTQCESNEKPAKSGSDGVENEIP